MISAVASAVASRAINANHSSGPNPPIIFLMLCVCKRAKNLNAIKRAAVTSNTTDTAAKAGPLLASDVVEGRLPHDVPAVPVPKVGATASGTEVLDVKRVVGYDGEDGEDFDKDGGVDSAEAEARTLGQKVF